MRMHVFWNERWDELKKNIGNKRGFVIRVYCLVLNPGTNQFFWILTVL
jgi:hypothetical protein